MWMWCMRTHFLLPRYYFIRLRALSIPDREISTRLACSRPVWHFFPPLTRTQKWRRRRRKDVCIWFVIFVEFHIFFSSIVSQHFPMLFYGRNVFFGFEVRVHPYACVAFSRQPPPLLAGFVADGFFPFHRKAWLICVYANDNDLWEMAALLNQKFKRHTVLTICDCIIVCVRRRDVACVSKTICLI